MERNGHPSDHCVALCSITFHVNQLCHFTLVENTAIEVKLFTNRRHVSFNQYVLGSKSGLGYNMFGMNIFSYSSNSTYT